MAKDKEFATLVGKAFLRELDLGNKESAIAFGRAFLLALGMQGPEPEDPHRHYKQWTKHTLQDSLPPVESGG